MEEELGGDEAELGVRTETDRSGGGGMLVFLALPSRFLSSSLRSIFSTCPH